MIIEHKVIGSTQTTFHDFIISQNGMNLTISPGSYIQQNQEKISSNEPTLFTIQTSTKETDYELWLNNSGAVVLSRDSDKEFSTVDNPIDRLAWFTIPENETSLDNVDIHVVRMVNG